MKNKFLKLMTVSLALSSCALLNSCKNNQTTTYVDNSYKSGDNNTMSTMLEEMSSNNKNYEKEYLQSTSQYLKSDGITLVKTNDGFGDDFIYNREATTNSSIYKYTVYGHVTTEGNFYFKVVYYSNRCDSQDIKYYNYNHYLRIDPYPESAYVDEGYRVSFNEDMSDASDRITISKNDLLKTVETTKEDSEEDTVDNETLYKYAGYTYDKDLKQYVKKIGYNGYAIVYHLDENGNELPTITYNQKAFANKTLFIWQEDTIIAEKSDASFTYYASDGKKHLVKTYYSNMADGTDSKEIETKFVFSTYKGYSENYIGICGYQVNDNKILDTNLKTYFYNNNAEIVYTTLFNLNYTSTVKLSDNVYKIDNCLYDNNLNYIDTVTYSSTLNALISESYTTIYDLSGNVVSNGKLFTTKNSVLYREDEEKYYTVYNSKLVEISGDYFDTNLQYGLQISVNKVDDVYKYVITSVDGKINTNFYSKNEKLTFTYDTYSFNGKSSLRLLTNSSIYSDQSLEKEISILLFNYYE